MQVSICTYKIYKCWDLNIHPAKSCKERHQTKCLEENFFKRNKKKYTLTVQFVRHTICKMLFGWTFVNQITSTLTVFPFMFIGCRELYDKRELFWVLYYIWKSQNYGDILCVWEVPVTVVMWKIAQWYFLLCITVSLLTTEPV